jgi:UPF0755 protein
MATSPRIHPHTSDKCRILKLIEESKPIRSFLKLLRRFLILLTLVGLAALATVAYVVVAPFGPSGQTIVKIPSGTPTSRIARQLQQQGIVRSRWAFLGLCALRGRTLEAGEYRFQGPLRMNQVWWRLRHGDVYTISVTIPEGSNIFDIGQRLQDAGLVSKQDFVAAAQQDTALIASLDASDPSVEGYLFPDTYKLEPGSSPQAIIAAMVRQFRQEAAKIGLTSHFHRIVTLASLIEKETPLESERPLVASVFVNRLAKGMPLMTDPSVIYAALLQGRYRGVIYQSDLDSDSSYNTYRHTGLPPGPICNPGIRSLEAAMHPAQTDYLYFVAASADPSGKSRFSATLEEHAKDVEAYRQAERKAARQ